VTKARSSIGVARKVSPNTGVASKRHGVANFLETGMNTGVRRERPWDIKDSQEETAVGTHYRSDYQPIRLVTLPSSCSSGSIRSGANYFRESSQYRTQIMKMVKAAQVLTQHSLREPGQVGSS